MTREVIDAQYRATGGIADRAEVLAAFADESAAYRSSNPGIVDVAYGPTQDEVADLFLPARSTPRIPVHIFIHGGYWYQFRKTEWSFLARGLCEKGAMVIVPTYSLCPAVSLSEIVRQMRTLIGWAHRNIARWGGDPDRIFISGHSAGGNLGLVLASQQWQGFYGVPRNVVKGVVAISGIFDLTPLPFSYLQDHLHLSAREVEEFSPAKHVTRLDIPVSLAVGELETDEFKRQTASLHSAHRAAGTEVDRMSIPDRNHLTILHDLSRPSGAICRMAAKQMGL